MRRKVAFLDDESYVYADASNVPGRYFYHCSDLNEGPCGEKLGKKDKLDKKYYIIQCIFNMGVYGDFFPNDANPPNVPQLRPIEKFRPLSKRPYSKLPSKHHTLKEFGRTWKIVTQDVGRKFWKNLMRNLKKKI